MTILKKPSALTLEHDNTALQQALIEIEQTITTYNLTPHDRQDARESILDMIRTQIENLEFPEVNPKEALDEIQNMLEDDADFNTTFRP